MDTDTDKVACFLGYGMNSSSREGGGVWNRREKASDGQAPHTPDHSVLQDVHNNVESDGKTVLHAASYIHHIMP